jgi:hypothetical protein
MIRLRMAITLTPKRAMILFFYLQTELSGFMAITLTPKRAMIQIRLQSDNGAVNLAITLTPKRAMIRRDSAEGHIYPIWQSPLRLSGQ